MKTETALIVLLLGWTAYFALHSLMASLKAKRWVARHWSRAVPGYRLFYNILSVVLILPLAGITLFSSAPWLWRWEGAAAWIANAFALAALIGFIWTTRYYSMAEFLGTQQWRRQESRVEDQEGFYISPLHRWVRHPWYFLGLVILWTRDMNLLIFTTAVMISFYLYIGSRLEERKLIVYHGDVYREYRRRVAGIIPLPWKHLSKKEARQLVESAR